VPPLTSPFEYWQFWILAAFAIVFIAEYVIDREDK